MDTCYCPDMIRPSFYKAFRPLAGKQHRCVECGRNIRKGEHYERAIGAWEGSFSTYKTCAYCLAVRDLLIAKMPCFCWSHGGLWTEIEGYLGDMPSGVQFAIGRIVVEARRDWFAPGAFAAEDFAPAIFAR